MRDRFNAGNITDLDAIAQGKRNHQLTALTDVNIVVWP